MHNIITTIDNENNKWRIFANRLITWLDLSYQYKDEITSIKRFFLETLVAARNTAIENTLS